MKWDTRGIVCSNNNELYGPVTVAVIDFSSILCLATVSIRY